MVGGERARRGGSSGRLRSRSTPVEPKFGQYNAYNEVTPFCDRVGTEGQISRSKGDADDPIQREEKPILIVIERGRLRSRKQ